MRNISFAEGEYYHIYLRGVDKRDIFHSENDYNSFAESLYLFNDSNYSHKNDPFDKITKITGHHLFGMDRNPFVSLISWTLMPNHYHLFLRQEQKNGISRFLHKANKAYSLNYNHKYQRNGTLFEGPFHAKHISNEAYLYHIALYVHLNILDLTPHLWRNGEVTDWNSAFEFMDRYEWSSHRLYVGCDQSLPIVNEDLAKSLFVSSNEYRDSLKFWSSRMINTDSFSRPATR